MKAIRAIVFISIATIISLLILPATSSALDKGTGRLVSVTPVNGGCFSGPTGGTVEAWDIAPGYTYTVRLADVTDCANGGTDATLDVRVNSSIQGHEYTDLVANYVSTGVYEFDFTLPGLSWCTLPILYCTTPGEWLDTGLFVIRHDGAGNPNGVPFAAHLRVSNWSEGCTDPVMVLGPECGAVGTEESSWGAVKAIHR